MKSGIGGEAETLEVALKGAPALLDGEHGRSAGEVADAAMATLDEGVEDQPDSRQIVGSDLMKDRRAELPVDEDDLQVALEQFLPEGGEPWPLGEEGGRSDDAAHVEGSHGADAIDILAHVIGAIADEDVVPGLAGRVFDGADHLGVIGVAAVGDDDADEVGAAGGEGAGDLVGLVVKLADGGVDALAGTFRDPRMVAQGEGDGHCREAQPFPDVAQCHLLLQPVTSRTTRPPRPSRWACLAGQVSRIVDDTGKDAGGETLARKMWRRRGRGRGGQRSPSGKWTDSGNWRIICPRHVEEETCQV